MPPVLVIGVAALTISSTPGLRQSSPSKLESTIT